MKKQWIKATEFERVGRTFVWSNIVWCGLSGTGIRFMTNAKKVSFHLIGDSSVCGQKTEGPARVSIWIDDKRQKDLMIEEAYVEVAVELDHTENGFHKVQLIKLSECAMSAFGIKEVVLEGESDVMFSKVVPKDKKIEFIGDSITCGYGVDMEDPATPFRTDTEDCTKGYAYKTAKILDAEYSLFSFSGYGIITGYTETDEIRGDQIVSAYYEKCGFSYAHPVAEGQDGPAFESQMWNFREYVPDVIVVNLGTNDSSYCKDKKDRLDWYKRDYKVFLRTIRKNNPQAKILCCLGLMPAGENIEALKELVTEYQKEEQDTQVFFLEIPLQKPENGLVSDFHPTDVSHTLAAEVVAKKIKGIL